MRSSDYRAAHFLDYADNFIAKVVFFLNFNPKPTKNKVETEYKTIYIKTDLVKKINNSALKYNTSFNNIIISILEYFFENNEQDN